MYKIAGLVMGIFAVISVLPIVNAANPDLTSEGDETIQRILDYCFSSTSSSNPVQDLIDRGIISSAFSGQDCQSIQNEKDLRKLDQSSNDLWKGLGNSK